MILRSADWKRFPTAVVHTETRNKSFLRLSEVYRQMGVKNCYFHLALMQPELSNIDPHDPDLTPDIKAKIIAECRYNPWYFLREVGLIPPMTGNTPVMVIANRGIIASWWLYMNHISHALILPRQKGKSTGADLLSGHLLTCVYRNTEMLLLTKDDDLRRRNVDRLNRILNLLPGYIYTKTKNDADNRHHVTCAARNNTLTILVGQANEIAANNQGRGAVVPHIQVDEGPFITTIQFVIPAMLMASSRVREEAERVGQPYCDFYTTTAGKLDTPAGAYMYKMINGGVPWSEMMYDLESEKELVDFVRNNSPGDGKPMVNVTLSHRQLGETDQWVADTARMTNATPDEVKRDLLNIWTTGSLSHPLSTKVTERIAKSAMDPEYIEVTKHGYALRWYIDKHRIDEYMASNTCALGMDTSDAIGRDAVTMIIINVKTLEVVCQGYFNETNLRRLSGFVADMMVRFDNLICIPERRSSGATFIDTLLIRLPAMRIDPFKRIFNVIVNDPAKYPDAHREIMKTPLERRSDAFYDRHSKYFGYATSGSGEYTRNALYSNVLQTAATRGANVVRDRQLIAEINGLVIDKRGKLDHKSGQHDDLVIAWLLTVWLLTHGRNLVHYGIHSPLSETLEDATCVTSRDDLEDRLAERHNQEMIKEEMEDLLNKLRNERDQIIMVRYEARLRKLDSKLKDAFSGDDTLDGLIRAAKDKRHRKARRSKTQNRLGVSSEGY